MKKIYNSAVYTKKLYNSKIFLYLDFFLNFYYYYYILNMLLINFSNFINEISKKIIVVN